jgi:hypothetical protein
MVQEGVDPSQPSLRPAEGSMGFTSPSREHAPKRGQRILNSGLLTGTPASGGRSRSPYTVEGLLSWS